MIYSHRDFAGGVVPLDHNAFVDCRFQDVTFIVHAASPVTIAGCTIRGRFGIAYRGPALTALREIGRLYHANAENARLVDALVDALIDQMREGRSISTTIDALKSPVLHSPTTTHLAQCIRTFYVWGAAERTVIDTLFADIRSGDLHRDAA